MKRVGLAAVGVLAVLLAGCGGGGSTLPPDVDEVAAKVGCESPTPDDIDEPWAVEVVNCVDGRRVLTFNTNTARDSYRKVAEEFGGSYESGNGYLIEQP